MIFRYIIYENPTVLVFVSKKRYKYWEIPIFIGWVVLYLQIDCHVHSYVSDQIFAPSGLHLISDWMQLENSCLIPITPTLGISLYFWPSVIYWLTAMLTLTYLIIDPCRESLTWYQTECKWKISVWFRFTSFSETLHWVWRNIDRVFPNWLQMSSQVADSLIPNSLGPKLCQGSPTLPFASPDDLGALLA